MAETSMGRFAEPALWVLVALGRGPAGSPAILDAVRMLDGRVGPATLIATLARLERRNLIERAITQGRPTYRLTSHSPEGAS